jgi:hypothetical protein
MISLFIMAWVCSGRAVLLFAMEIWQASAGPMEIDQWGVLARQGDCVFYRGHSIIGTRPLASLAVPLVLPMVGWIVLASKRPGRRRGFPMDTTKGAS